MPVPRFCLRLLSNLVKQKPRAAEEAFHSIGEGFPAPAGQVLPRTEERSVLSTRGMHVIQANMQRSVAVLLQGKPFAHCNCDVRRKIADWMDGSG